MAKDEKIRVKVNAPSHWYFSMDYFEGSTTELIKNLQAIPEEHKAFIKKLDDNASLQPRNQRYKIDPTWYLIDEYKFNVNYSHDGYEIDLEFWRWETDEEFNNRIEANKKRSESAKKAAVARKKSEEEKERKLLLELKKKYEPETLIQESVKKPEQSISSIEEPVQPSHKKGTTCSSCNGQGMTPNFGPGAPTSWNVCGGCGGYGVWGGDE
jgi:hypothetical protein